MPSAKPLHLFDPSSTNGKVIVLFTDGKTTAGANPSPVAAAARASGIIIYCIGLVGSDGIDAPLHSTTGQPTRMPPTWPSRRTMPSWRTLFEDLAENISKPGATNIVIDEVLNPDFTITSISMPTKGAATMLNQTSLRWTIDQLGVTANEGASLEFWVRHTGNSSGNKLVNQSITYTDSENNQAIFPTPSVLVDCGIVVMPEPGPEPVDITIGRCQDSLVYDAGDVALESLGRILQLDVNLKNVCPGKRAALGVVLTEVDQEGNEHQRGMKAMTIPALQFPTCRDVLVKCVKFVLPENMDVSSENPPAICNARNFKARLIAHYIDSDFRCCELPEQSGSVQ